MTDPNQTEAQVNRIVDTIPTYHQEKRTQQCTTFLQLTDNLATVSFSVIFGAFSYVYPVTIAGDNVSTTYIGNEASICIPSGATITIGNKQYTYAASNEKLVFSDDKQTSGPKPIFEEVIGTTNRSQINSVNSFNIGNSISHGINTFIGYNSQQKTSSVDHTPKEKPIDLTIEKLPPQSEEQNDTKTDEEAMQCTVCMNNRVNTIVRPCKHARMCITCSREIGKTADAKCPICMVKIESIEVIYI